MSVTQLERIRLLFASTLCFAAAATIFPAHGEDAHIFCNNMNTLVGEAKSGFANWQTSSSMDSTPLTLPDAQDCSTVRLLSGESAYHCSWEFPYRTAEAYDTFNAFDRSIKDCFGERAHLGSDQNVNHPDFYEARQYHVGHVNVTLSIKDKSALQSTLVFVRVQAARPE